MKKILSMLFFVLTVTASAQEDAWVYFNSKPDEAIYLSNPLSMLSQRALDRRALQNILLDYKDVPISENYIQLVENAPGVTVMAKSKWMNAVHVRGNFEDVSNLSNLSFVNNIVFANQLLNPNFSGKNANSVGYSKAYNSENSQINYNYGNSGNQVEMLNGHLLHQQDYTGSGKIIAVLDSGFPGVNTAAPFASLFADSRILGGYNFVSRNTNIYSLNNHGTLVLSTMGGSAENLVGTAPKASYYLFTTEDASSENPIEESLWVEAAETADSLGVDIINTSLGYFTYDNPNYSYTYDDINGSTSFIARGADIAFSRGMIVVVSAGNSGNSANPHIATPADAVNVLTVGAVTASSAYASFSSIGPSFDGRVKPDIAAQGQNAVISNTAGTITTANGTSFSSPIVGGMVACLWQALPNKTNQQIVQLIKESAHLYNTPNMQLGYGIPDFNQALLSGLGIDEFGDESFIVYPNPATDYFSIGFPTELKASEILIYNSLGQLVLNRKFDTNERIAIQNLSNGIYFYKIKSSKKTQSGKLLIK